MSDFDNLREDEYERKLEASNEARDAAIDYHADNWMTAVTKSVKKSNGGFKYVREYVGKDFDFKYVPRPANSVDVFIEELHSLDFMERAAKILIDIKNGGGVHMELLNNLFDDMAANYADYQYEKNIKD